jgi:hypothetical protein
MAEVPHQRRPATLKKEASRHHPELEHAHEALGHGPRKDPQPAEGVFVSIPRGCEVPAPLLDHSVEVLTETVQIPPAERSHGFSVSSGADSP